MTPAQSRTLLRACGQALFGPAWVSPVADLLGVNRRSVNQYLTEDGANARTIPARVWPVLRAGLLEKRKVCRALAGRVPRD